MLIKVVALSPFMITLLVLTSAMPFEVFLSFRGIDTRYTFTDHLYRRLKQAGFQTFRDKEGIRRGEKIDLEIEKAINESKASVIVFSKNYANSISCLNELKLIMERRTFGHIALPIFYRVDPSNVGEQTGTYGDAFIKHRKNVELPKNLVKEWRAALTEAANLGGMLIDESYETDFLDDIVKVVEVRLNRTGLPSAIIRRALELKDRCKALIVQKTENKLNRTELTNPPTFDWFFKVMFLVLLVCQLVTLYSFCRLWPTNPLPNPAMPDPVNRAGHSVFLSYRTSSNSRKFTHSLCKALNESGISTFKSDGIWSTNQRNKVAGWLEESQICIIVFSKEYASLPNCLEQLEMIMEHRQIRRHTVAPIFYDVPRRDVVEQQGSYRAIFQGYMNNRPTQVKRWRCALRQVSDLKEMTLKGRNNKESIQLLVQEIKGKLNGPDNP